MVSVNYELRPDDYWQFVKYRQWKKAGRPLPVFFFLLLLHGGWIAEALSLPGFLRAASLAACGQCLLLPWMTWFLYAEVWGLKRRSLKAAQKTVGLLGPHRLRIGPLSLRDKAPGQQRCALWDSVTEVIETRRHIFLCLGRQEAFVVPKSAFATVTDAGRFLDFARTCRENSRWNALPRSNDPTSWPPAPRLRI